MKPATVTKAALLLLCFLSVVVGLLVFRDGHMDLRMAFWSIIGLLTVIALKP